MGELSSLLCWLFVLKGVFAQGQLGLKKEHRFVTLHSEETFVLRLLEVPRLASITVNVSNPQDSLEIHIAAPEVRFRKELANFELVEGISLPFYKDYGRISELQGWQSGIWSAETMRSAFTIKHWFHDLEDDSGDVFSHVVLFRAKPMRMIDLTRPCLNNVIYTGPLKAVRSLLLYADSANCPLFLMSNYPVTRFSNFGLKGNGSVVLSKVSVKGNSVPIIELDNSNYKFWTPTTIGAYVIRVDLPKSVSLNLTVSVGDKSSSKTSVIPSSLGTISSASYGLSAPVRFVSEPSLNRVGEKFPFVERSPGERPAESFELTSEIPRRYRIQIVDIAKGVNLNISTDRGQVGFQKNPGWRADFVASKVRFDYTNNNDKGSCCATRSPNVLQLRIAL
ncbi:hypothetical protein L596_008029 [Steinernema carpocapsae]|uniref:Uncharacterized protein n=1 Tax=Steinernema carpocapsae TaxID=34508 RepID=A0A4U5PBS7_STECR|nr:hypothetical protein L596_008029 [Steinernema carpocapsae]